MLVELSQLLFNRLGIIMLFAFLITKLDIFKNYIVKEKLSISDQIFFSLLFGGIGIITTYWGIEVLGGIVNSRSIAIVVSGLIGGPIVGFGAGLVAGIHRMLMSAGRLTAIACGLSTIMGGIIGGLAKNYIHEKNRKWLYGIIIGIIAEIIQMSMILLIARPFTDALHIVKVIFIPMTFINSLGIGIFLALIQEIYNDRERAGAIQAQLALSIANKTLPFLRKGLNEASANQTANIIYDMAGMHAVAITDTQKILAHVGAANDHHKKGSYITTNLSQKAILDKKHMVAQKKVQIECHNQSCPLKSAIVVPLMEKNNVIGTLKLYKTSSHDIRRTDIELAKGLAHLFSTQIELSKVDYQKTLLRKAELRRLQAQIRPHFLFNTLNTVVSFCRTDPNKARQLLLELSFFLRNSFQNAEEFITLEKEIAIIKSYLSIVTARYGDKINIHFDIQEKSCIQIPSLILQPIIENAIKHGLLPKTEPGHVYIHIRNHGDYVTFEVKDDGVGMAPDQLKNLLTNPSTTSGIGITNVNERLKTTCNEELHITSTQSTGTTVTFKIHKEMSYPC